jgi:hypothetical protein
MVKLNNMVESAWQGNLLTSWWLGSKETEASQNSLQEPAPNDPRTPTRHHLLKLSLPPNNTMGWAKPLIHFRLKLWQLVAY